MKSTLAQADRVSARENAKKTKTWKIGEECAGGIIRAKANGETVKIEIIDWNTGAINDSKIGGKLHRYDLELFMHNFTTSFYAVTIIEWIKANVWGNK